MSQFEVDGESLLINGIEPNFWRGLTDNDLGAKAFEWADVWREASKKRQLTLIEVNSASSSEVLVKTHFVLPTVESEYQISYTVFANGEIRVATQFTPYGKKSCQYLCVSVLN